MTTAFHVKGINGNLATISNEGEIFTRLRFSSAENVTLVSDNVALTLVKPRSKQKMIITGIIVNTNRDVGVNGAIIEVYEATDANSTTVAKAILKFDLIKNETVVTSPILIETQAGRYINTKASDSEVNVTLLCYFVEDV